MNTLDWLIVAAYVLLIVGLSVFIGRRQRNQVDYYLAGRSMRPWLVGSSLMANQVSAISLVSAPAFIAVRSGGGLVWLQYEFAVPLAMIAIMVFLVPAYRAAGGFTIYEWLERRFGGGVRSAMAFIFLVSRSMASGVILLTTSIVTSVCTGLGLPETILIIGLITLIYTSVGGITVDIYSDLMQLVILWVSAAATIFVLLGLSGCDFTGIGAGARLAVFDVRSTGFGDGKTFSLWPMLFGGFFLYLSYYGCDQSQAQRLMTTDSSMSAAKSLVWNGLLRFPLVLTYCAVGVLIIPFLEKFPDFARGIGERQPDYLMPLFFVRFIPNGLLGVIIAGIFAATMSSIDSAINSLSASTWSDFLVKRWPSLETISDRRKILLSRGITVLWGLITAGFALHLSGGRETVIELVNRIGSAFYGPIAGVFFLGLLSKRASGRSALCGLFIGTAINIVLWTIFERQVSWMWWNLTGFAGAFITGIALGRRQDITPSRPPFLSWPSARRYALIMIFWFLFIVALCACLELLFA